MGIVRLEYERTTLYDTMTILIFKVDKQKQKLLGKKHFFEVGKQEVHVQFGCVIVVVMEFNVAKRIFRDF